MKVKQLKRKMAALLAVAMVMTGQPSGVLAGGMPGDSGEASTEVTETVSTDSDATQNTEPDGSEIPPATNSTADSGTSGGNGGTGTDIPKEEQETFEVTYQVEPEEGAKVTGDRKVKTGETLEFTVRVNDGYELDSVSVSGDVLEPVEETENKYTYEAENIMQAPEVEVTLTEEEKPAFSYEETIDGITVSLTAEEGVLPDGTKAEVKKVSVPKDAKETEEGEELIEAVAFDITLYDAEGNELDNSWAENGSVKVTFSGAELEEKQEKADKVEILHYEDEDAEPDVEAYAPGEELAYDAEHFSLFIARVMAAPRATMSVYVSNTGNDENGDGTEDNPYASLKKAVDDVSNGGTVYVMSDIENTEVAKVWDKSITISSDPEEMEKNGGNAFIITRGDEFEQSSDDRRYFYNPAMIEVVGEPNNGIVSHLTIENLVLDDDGKTGYNQDPNELYFMQAGPEAGVSSQLIVQDAIIAAYDGKGEITLGEGAVLKDFGGMSAVRLSGCTLTMKSGSLICDETVTSRVTGKYPDKQLISFGPAGAVWMQTGKLIMEEGSRIDNIFGRSIYNEGGKATIGGTISNGRSGGGVMLQNDIFANGFVVYLRNEAKMTLTETGIIEDTPETISSNKGTAIYVMGGSTIITEEGSKIRNITAASSDYGDGRVVYADGGNDGHFAGEIYGCNSKNTIGFSGASDEDDPYNLYIAPSAAFHDNICTDYGVVYLQSFGTTDFYGKIYKNTVANTGAGIAMGHNMDGSKVIMHEGAEIKDNTLNCTYNKWPNTKNSGGGGVTVRRGTFIMEGGVISGNRVLNSQEDPEDCYGGGVQVVNGGTFIMNGGEITDNVTTGPGGGIGYNGNPFGGEPQVQINGGTISGNKMYVDIPASVDAPISGGIENDLAIVNGHLGPYSTINRYFTVSEAADIGNPDIFMQKYDFTLVDPQRNTKLGNAKEDCETVVKEKYGNQPHYLSEVKGSFWYQSQEDLTLRISGLKYDETKPLFVSIVETKEDGIPIDNQQPTLQAVSPDIDGVVTLPLPGNTNGYAVVFVQEQNASNLVSVVPLNMTAYMGGNGGYDSVVDEEGNLVKGGSSSLPRPIFRVTAPQGIKLTDLTFVNDDSNNSWRLETVNADKGYYYFVPTKDTMPQVRVEYNDGTSAVVEDDFDPSVEGDVFKEYIVTIYTGGTAGNVRANAAENYYTVITGPGILTVRAVEKETGATSPIVSQVPTSVVTGSATAVELAGTVYTLNDTDVELSEDSVPALLFDKIITSDGVDREDALKEAIGAEYDNYQFQYLDLVDANNGNVWISSSKGTDIYWGYPEGTDKETELKLIHFKNLHRDGTASGFDTEDIAQAELEEVQIEKLDTAIKFHVDKGGFSPFAVVWQNEAQPEPEDKTFTITATAGEHGSISPSGTVEVKEGEDLTFTITPDAGYKIDKIIVDGHEVETVNSYTFENVTGRHTIEVSFSRKSTGGSSPSGSGSSGSGVAYTVGLNGNWVHMDPNDINTPISQMVPDGATPVSNPEWHQWKFILTDGSALTNRWAFIRNPYAVEGQPSEGWFSFDENGIMNYGWYLDQSTGKWYFLHRQSDGMLGTMMEGWHHDEQDGRWYYLQPGSGEMLLGWQEIGGRWYYFNPNAPQVTWNYNEATGGWTYNGSQSRPYGSMYQNEVTPDGYQVDGNGAWVQ